MSRFPWGSSDSNRFHCPAVSQDLCAPQRRSELEASEAVLGLLIDSGSGGRMAYLPGVAKVEDSWREWLDECDVAAV